MPSGRTRDPDAKRAKIIAAAEQLFAGKRFHEVTTDDIAREAGVSKGTIYRYFADKDQLFYQIATSGFDDLRDQLETLANDTELEGITLITQACERVVCFMRRRRRVLGMQQAEEERAAAKGGRDKKLWGQTRAEVVDALAKCLANAQRSKAVATTHAPEVLAQLLMGMLRARGRNLGGSIPVSAVVDLFLNGSRPQ